MQISCGCQCLFVCVALVFVSLTSAEYQWSGLVNTLLSSFDYKCPDNFAVTGVASLFDDTSNDRRWEFQCASGGNLANVSSTCVLQSAVHVIRDDITFNCPNDGYIAGFSTLYSSSDEDRYWSPYCCTRPNSTLVNCHTLSSNWENILEGPLNWTASNDRILAGIFSFFSSFNRDRRWRFRQCELQVTCGDPGIPDNAMRVGDSYLYEDTVVFSCNNGYYQSSGPENGERICQDTGFWSETQPVCSLCTNIENCADIRCTNPTDHSCYKCASDNGVALGERGYENFNTSCEPLCSWLDAFCYPGVCTAGPSTCNCSVGFSGSDCLQIDTEPDLESCTIILSALTTTCSLNVTTTHYINFMPTNLLGEWEALFMGPSPAPVKPAYVESYGVGISQSWIEASVFRQDSYPSDPATVTRHLCTTVDLSPDNPKSNLVMCETSANASDLSNHTFLHGDWFKVTVYISNGGYLNISDLDVNETITYYYTGTPITPFSLFVIDIHPPTHCSEIISEICLANQEILEETLVHNTLSVVWGGWSDTPSGLKKYKIEVYKLVYNSVSRLLDKDISFEYAPEINDEGKTSYSMDFSLSDEGPYSIVLSTTDNAGNKQYARRIIVYDETSQLLENPDIPLAITSGFIDGGAYWHNSTTAPITVGGEGHFYNTNFKTSNWLAPVANHTPPIPSQFDDSDRAGTPNALGVTQLSYTYIIDQQGGNSADGQMQPGSFPYSTVDLALSNVEVTPTVNDGDSVSIWFEARDFKANPPVYEKVLVHIDSSPPVVQGLGLKKEGVLELVSLYGSEDLLDLDIVFEAFDKHSGLYEIDWIIETDSQEIASGQVVITNYDQAVCAIDPDCTCDIVDHCHKIPHSITLTSANFLSGSEAKHDTDYYITITAYNHARLSSSVTRQFTVDLTPPLSGAVFEGDGEGDILDIDYIQDFNYNVHWSGFFDRETGILIYQYIISTECATASSFQYPNMGTSPAIDTNQTSVHWSAPIAGKYYTTVVAYNSAYQPSQPVCSDGIVIDTEPPVFKGIVIPGGVAREGLVNVLGEVWLIHSNQERSHVKDASELCLNVSTSITMEELVAFPIRYNGSVPATIHSNLCNQFLPYASIIYTPIDTVFNITWTVTDNNGIRDYQIGIASAYNATTDPDVIPLQSTAGHTHFSVHSPLFIAGYKFYVVVKAMDLALHESLSIIGPIVIDTSSPLINGSLATDIYGGIMVVSWDKHAFIDHEDVFPLDRYQYAIGRTQYGEDVLPFTPIPTVPSPLCSAHHCIVIDTETIGFLPGNNYHVTVKVINTGNLATIVPINPYTMPFRLTDCLSVFEYEDSPASTYFIQAKDQDIIFNYTAVSIGWRGLTDEHFNVTFSVALGTQPGSSNIIGFTAVNTGVNTHTFTDLMLISGTYYYSTVRAANMLNTVTVSSDGFLALHSIISDNEDAFIWDGWSDEFDEDYQLSNSLAAAHWYYPSSISRHISHYEWALYQAWNEDINNLTIVLQYTNNGAINYTAHSVHLQSGILYVSAVKACFQSKCLQPVYSNGFRLASPPTPLSLSAFYTPTDVIDPLGHSNQGQLKISWTPFSDPEMHYYEWSIGSGKNGNQLITNWTRLAPDISNVSTVLSVPLSFHSTHFVTVRGVNRAGIEGRITTELVISHAEFLPIQVYDVDASLVPSTVNDWKNIEFHYFNYLDLDYTKSNSSLSAVWPNLRYTQYNYSISTSALFVPCQEPYPVSCGSTIVNGITATSLELVDGEIYYFCVQALHENLYSPSLSAPQVLTVCSDGIVVDLSPPQAGCVQIVPSLQIGDIPELFSGERESSGIEDNNGGMSLNLDNSHSCVNSSGSQASTSELHIVWDWFQDIEQFGNGPYKYGVAYYEYSIGTSKGCPYVVKFTNVGVVKEVIVTGLTLQHGLTYYATVRATDHTGQQTLVTSHGLTIDLTPPTFGRVWIDTPTTIAVTSPTQLTPKWDLVMDEDSGISGLYWALGSSAGLSDLSPWQKINRIASSIIVNMSFPDGQPVIFSLLALNNAGLLSVHSSHRVIYDTTPPCSSRVFDGPKPIQGYWDLDYTTNHTHLQAHWNSFSDPHTYVTEYYWAIGSCAGCIDVMPFISIGLFREAVRRYLYKHSHTYYISVKGCSYYSGCIIAHSDGITIDVTGPITSLLHHGLSPGVSMQFQASRHTLTCYWTGFHDSESGLSHFIYYAGTSPGDQSYVTPTTLPSTMTSFVAHSPFSSLDLLPVNRIVYVTLEAYNRAGLSHFVSSKGVFISETSPQLLGKASINTSWSSSLISNTQYTNSALRLTWNFTDTYTTVDQYFWTLFSDYSSYQPVSPSYDYNILHTTLTNLNLHDGIRLAAVVIACNQIGLCNRNKTDYILIDSSPPISGYFALTTDSTASLPWSIADGMVWYHNNKLSSSELNLTFTGFSDPHSGVTEYWATIGSYYGGRDLYNPVSPLIIQEHSSNPLVSVATVQLSRYLSTSEVISIWLWATNGVGLQSIIAQGSFEVVLFNINSTETGYLKLLRSQHCPIYSCRGHCTCNKQGHLCDVTVNGSICHELESTSLPENMKVSISNFISQLATPSNATIPLFTALTDKLTALVEFDAPSFQWIEWSVGEKGQNPGTGVFDLSSDPIWFPLGLDTTPIFNIGPTHPLEQGKTYVFYARVWYNSTHFAVFESEGVTIDSYSPQISQGFRLRETTSLDPMDADFISNTSQLNLKWNNVFSKIVSGEYLNFEVAIGETPGSDNVLSFISINNLTSLDLTDLNLKGNRKYFSSVRATNPLGIMATSISDGFLVDLTPPKAGVIFNGGHLYDSIAQSDVTSFSVRLLGFHDPESSIRNFQMTMSKSSLSPLDYRDIGISTHYTMADLLLEDGERYTSYIIAVNNAGGEHAVQSTDYIIDNTTPTLIHCHLSGNLIKNPSFEDGQDPYEFGKNLSSVLNYNIDGLVRIEGTHYLQNECHNSRVMPADGNFSLEVPHYISQMIYNVIPYTDYYLSFDILIQSNKETKFRVECPGIDHRFIIPASTDNCRWKAESFKCTTRNSTTMKITISASDDSITVDNLSLKYCTETFSITTNRFKRHSDDSSETPKAFSSSSVSLSLPIDDLQSGILNMEYALGTEPGGQQILPYTSNGDQNFAYLDLTNFNIAHNTSLYVSVIATNYAKLTKKFYSEPIQIDTTPPEIYNGGLKEVLEEEGDDIDYSISSIVQLDWSGIVDEESGIKHCLWGLGLSPGVTDLQPFTVSNSTAVNSSDLSSLVSHGTTVYSTVVCLNNAGLTSGSQSDGVTLLFNKPNHQLATVSVLSSTLTWYESESGYLSSYSFQLIWNGFQDVSGAPLYYQVRIKENGTVLGEEEGWNNVGKLRQATLENVTVSKNILHMVEVRSYAVFGLMSEAVSEIFSIVPLAPTWNNIGINATWIANQLTLEWTNVFTSPSPLTYEVSLGTQLGSTSIRRWSSPIQETDRARIVITEPGLSSKNDYILSLNAISYNGLSTAANYMISDDVTIYLPV